MHLNYLLLSTKEQGYGEEERTHTKADNLVARLKMNWKRVFIYAYRNEGNAVPSRRRPEPSSSPPPVKVTHNSQSAADHVTRTDNYTIVKKLLSSPLCHTRPIGHAQKALPPASSSPCLLADCPPEKAPRRVNQLCPPECTMKDEC
jgi:hypothetical protein